MMKNVLTEIDAAIETAIAEKPNGTLQEQHEAAMLALNWSADSARIEARTIETGGYNLQTLQARVSESVFTYGI